MPENDRVIEITARVEDRLAALAEACRTYGESARRFRVYLEAGGSLEEALRNERGVAAREQLRTAMGNFESTRHELRVRAFHTLRRRGRSVTEIAHLFGVSRQLVSRALNAEPDPDA